MSNPISWLFPKYKPDPEWEKKVRAVDAKIARNEELTDEDKGIIIDDCLKRNSVVFDRLAEI